MKKIISIVVAAAALVGLSACGGSADSLDEAKAACASASETLRKNTNEYNNLVNGDGSVLSALTDADVKDPSTLQTLNDALAEEVPEGVYCNVKTSDELNANAKKIDENAKWYADHAKSLRRAIDAVKASKR